MYGYQPLRNSLMESGSPIALTQKVDASYDAAVFLRVCLDNEGNAVAVWSFPDGDKMVIQSATLPYGSAHWIPAPGPLANNVELQAGPFLQLDQKGQALAAWGNQRDGKYFIESARLPQNRSGWISLTPLAIPYSFTGAAMHVNPEGKAWLIWMKGFVNFGDGENVAVSALSPNSTHWTPPETIVEKAGITYYGPQIVSDLQGNVLATWQENSQKNLLFVAYQRSKESKQWKKTDFQNIKERYSSRGWLSLDPEGNALFVWHPYDTVMLNSRLPKGESVWTTPTLITSEGIFWSKGAIDSKGNRLLTWIGLDDNMLTTSTLPVRENTWTAPVTITSAGASLQECRLSSDGSAVILYGDFWTILNAVVGKPF